MGEFSYGVSALGPWSLDAATLAERRLARVGSGGRAYDAAIMGVPRGRAAACARARASKKSSAEKGVGTEAGE